VTPFEMIAFMGKIVAINFFCPIILGVKMKKEKFQV
jgi:hypothetical protein